MPDQWWIQDFPEQGAPTIKGGGEPIILVISPPPKNYMYVFAIFGTLLIS